ncbi:MAG TPA: SDR family oxidoreductase [Saprospiraceae bacterium]|nr:SDR family oxidoreductase [Saprospiraceae bacterium]
MNAIITGASKGIGRAIACLLAEKGFDLIVCARGKKGLDDLEKEISQINPKIKFHSLQVDLGTTEGAEAFGRFCLEVCPSIDILINNAGIFIPGEIHKEEPGLLEKLIQTNLFSAYHLTKALLPKMIRDQHGHIFNMCSVASIQAYPNGGSYSISKFALLGLTKVLREELKEKGIKVTAIIPGATWSDSWQGVELPETRLMEARDIALSILNAFQLSPQAVVEEIILRPILGDL